MIQIWWGIIRMSSFENFWRGQAFQLLLNTVQLRENADTYVYQFINGANISHTGSDNSQVIDKVKAHILTAYSEISMPGWHYDSTSDQIRISNDIENNGDLFLSFDSDTLNQVQEHFEGKKSPQRPVYEALLPTSWEKMQLEAEISPDNNSDTDKDSLTDWQEVNTKLLIWNENGSFELPTFLDVVSMSNYIYVLKAFDRLKGAAYELPIISEIWKRRVLPIVSDPTKKDSDDDGIGDYDEVHGITYTMPNEQEKIHNGDPLKKGLADGITGYLSLVACGYDDMEFNSGHVFFCVYKLY